MSLRPRVLSSWCPCVWACLDVRASGTAIHSGHFAACVSLATFTGLIALSAIQPAKWRNKKRKGRNRKANTQTASCHYASNPQHVLATFDNCPSDLLPRQICDQKEKHKKKKKASEFPFDINELRDASPRLTLPIIVKNRAKHSIPRLRW